MDRSALKSIHWIDLPLRGRASPSKNRIGR